MLMDKGRKHTCMHIETPQHTEIIHLGAPDGNAQSYPH